MLPEYEWPVDGRRDVGWFDETLNQVAQEKTGRIVFLAGNSAGVLQQVLRRAQNLSQWLVGGPDEPQGSDNVNAALMNLGSGAAGLLLHPMAGVLVAAGEVLRQVSAYDLKGRQASLFGMLEELASEAYTTGQGLVLGVRPENANDEHWCNLLVHLRSRYGRLANRPVVLIVQLPDYCPQRPGDVTAEYSALVRLAASMASDGRAAWVFTPLLSVAELLQCKLMDKDVAGELVSTSGGDDREAADLWHRWVTRGHVVPDAEGAWHWGRVRPDIAGALERNLVKRYGSDFSRAETVATALSCAALLPYQFSVRAVVEVVTEQAHLSGQAQPSTGLNRERLEREFESLCDTTDAVALIAICEPDSKEVAKDQILYRFINPTIKRLLASTVGDDLRTLWTKKLVSSIRSLHPGGGPLDADLAYCLRGLGDRSSSTVVQKRIAERAALASAREEAAILTQLLEADLGNFDPVGRLVAVSECLLRNLRSNEALAAAQVASEAASKRHDIDGHGRAHVLMALAEAHVANGERALGARASTRAIALLEAYPNPKRHADLVRALTQLAENATYGNSLDIEGAKTYARKAVRQARIVASTGTQIPSQALLCPQALNVLALCYSAAGEPRRAAARIRLGIRILMGQAALLDSEGAQELLWRMRFNLGHALRGMDKLAEAKQHFERAAKIAARLPDDHNWRGRYAHSLDELVLVDLLLGADLPTAVARGEIALSIWQELVAIRPQDAISTADLTHSATRLGGVYLTARNFRQARWAYRLSLGGIEAVPPHQRTRHQIDDLAISRMSLEWLDREHPAL